MTAAATPGGRRGLPRRFVRHRERYPYSPDREPQPLPARDLLAEESAGRRRHQQRLQPDDQRHHARRHTVVDRAEYTAEIAAVDQHAGDGHMSCLLHVLRPLGLEHECRRHQKREHEGEA